MGQTIPGIPRTYGSTDSDKMKADLYEVAKNSGTSASPIYALDATRKQRLDELAANLGSIAGFIMADGTVAMIHNLNIGGNNIIGVDTIQDDSNVDSIQVTQRLLYDTADHLIAKWSSINTGFGITTLLTAFFAYLKSDNLTANRTFQFPDQSGTLALYGDIPSKVTSGTTISLLEDEANWTNNRYTGVAAITGQKTGDWYDNGVIRYNFVTGVSLIGRIPYANL